MPSVNMRVFSQIVFLSVFIVFHHFSEGGIFVGEGLYVGCYRNFRSRHSTDALFRECLETCAKNQYNFIALQKHSDCYCGDHVLDRISSSNCVGLEHFAVYAIVPTYMGCFKDSPIRDLPEILSHEGMKNEECLSVCRAHRNTRYAATQAIRYCLCGNNFGKYGKADELQCDSKCAGDTSQSCGAQWRNSIYSVYHIPGLQLDYADVFHCAGNVDIYGHCDGIRCKPGWKGHKCQNRDCRVSNGNCGGNKCTEYAVRGERISECDCLDKLKSTSIFDICRP